MAQKLFIEKGSTEFYPFLYWLMNCLDQIWFPFLASILTTLTFAAAMGPWSILSNLHLEARICRSTSFARILSKRLVSIARMHGRTEMISLSLSASCGQSHACVHVQSHDDMTHISSQVERPWGDLGERLHAIIIIK